MADLSHQGDEMSITLLCIEIKRESKLMHHIKTDEMCLNIFLGHSNMKFRFII